MIRILLLTPLLLIGCAVEPDEGNLEYSYAPEAEDELDVYTECFDVGYARGADCQTVQDLVAIHPGYVCDDDPGCEADCEAGIRDGYDAGYANDCPSPWPGI